MKKVFSTTQEVYHQWAAWGMYNSACHVQPNEGHGRNSSKSVSFDSEYAYSYSTEMAFWFWDCVLLNTGKYSSSTTKHQGQIRNSIAEEQQIIEIPCNSKGKVFLPYKVINAFQQEMDYLISKLDKARNKGKYTEQLYNLGRNIQRYVHFLGDHQNNRTIDATNYLDIDISILMAMVTAIDAKDLLQSVNRYRIEKEKYLKEIKRKNLAIEKWQFRAALKDWRNNKSAQCPYIINESKSYVRITADGNNIETHRHARVPTKDAMRLYQLATKQRLKAKELQKSLPVGSYILRSIAANGDCVVGCHSFTWTELNRCFKQYQQLKA
jgi:hypothetical protein